jgi:methyl-accepting chemotaxis protein
LSIGFSIAAMISRPLKEMVAVVGSLTTGDFTKTLKSKGNREVNQLVNSLNNAIKSLWEGMATTEEFSAIAEQQSASAEEVAAQAGNLSKIAETLKYSVAQFKI